MSTLKATILEQPALFRFHVNGDRIIWKSDSPQPERRTVRGGVMINSCLSLSLWPLIWWENNNPWLCGNPVLSCQWYSLHVNYFYWEMSMDFIWMQRRRHWSFARKLTAKQVGHSGLLKEKPNFLKNQNANRQYFLWRHNDNGGIVFRWVAAFVCFCALLCV